MVRALLGFSAILVSSFLLVISLPPSGSYGGFLCLVPLLIAIRGVGFLRGFVAGLLTCVASAAWSVYGHIYPDLLPDGSHNWTWAGFALFGIVIGLACGVWAEIKSPNWRTAILLSAVAVICEALSLLLLPMHLALTGYKNLFLLNVASYGGVWLMTYLIWLPNFLVATFVRGKSQITAGVGVLLAILFLLAKNSSLIPNKPIHLTIGVVQTQSSEEESFLKLVNSSNQGREPDIVVLPELAGAPMAINGDTKELEQLAKNIKMPPFCTSYEDGNKPLPHNVASLFTREAKLGEYRKRKLFGGESAIHSSGNKPTTVEFNGNKFALAICFDSCFPNIMRDAFASGAKVLLLPTADPDSPNGFVQAIHAAYTPIRAAEYGVTIARADATAYSMIVDSYGRIWNSIPLGQEEMSVAPANVTGRDTLYGRLGDWFLYLCGLIVLGSITRQLVKRRTLQN